MTRRIKAMPTVTIFPDVAESFSVDFIFRTMSSGGREGMGREVAFGLERKGIRTSWDEFWYDFKEQWVALIAPNIDNCSRNNWQSG